jgi:DNA invertase Pin-like site-specific DNA recombinase
MGVTTGWRLIHRGVTDVGIKPMEKMIGYRRVSTKKQGESGLGREAQDAAIDAYARSAGGKVEGAYTEVESGKRSDRPELARALAHARRAKATLVVAKLDRLSRNVAFLSALMESKVPFICCDNPYATPLTVHILAAVAEDEVKRISQRTKDALAAYKAGKRVSKRTREMYPGGVPAEVVEATAGKLGADLVGSYLTDADRAKGRAVANREQRRQAIAVYSDLAGDMRRWRAEGASLAAIARRLNDDGHTTRNGTPWGKVQVKRVLERT